MPLEMKRTKRILIIFLIFSGVLFCLAFVLNGLFPVPTQKLRPELSTIVLDSDKRLLRAFLTEDEKWRLPLPLEDANENLKRFVVAFEDGYFYHHPGVNPLSVLRASYQNLLAGKVVSGASTITMQLARMIEPKRRTLFAKAIEAFRAFQIEWRFSKNEILEMYLNLAPYGGNIEGARAAAWSYFGKSVKDLSTAEAALLCVLPNAPNDNRPDLHPAQAQKARNRALRLLYRKGAIKNKRILAEALDEAIKHQRLPLPFHAPHFSRFVRNNFGERKSLQTTLKRPLQRTVKRILKRNIEAVRHADISQMAAVVIENDSGHVLAMVGSYEFFEEKHFGQVNGALAPRSPGSALKPFIYALALERGMVTPDSLLADIPVEYGAYSPENYDGRFRGVVRAEEALQTSLNVPAVDLLHRLGKDGLYPFLLKAGVTTLDPNENRYGLSLALGGCEVNLLELTNAYAVLARQGVYKPAKMLLNQTTPKKRILDKGAAYLVTEMLTGLKHPDFPDYWEASYTLDKVAWKTGTSYGHRDAWSIGYNKTYTVGVWAGNFNGVGAASLVGADIATPALFDIFHALPKKEENRWFPKPETVATREICALSGKIPTENCPSRKEGFFLNNVSSQESCKMHKAFDIDKKTGHRLCSLCREGKDYKRKTFEMWPNRINRWLEKHGLPMEKPPKHNPACQAPQGGKPPMIHSPSEGVEYILRASAPLHYQKIPLQASISSDAQRLFWFVDGVLHYEGSPDADVFYQPTRGRHTFLCADDLGRASKVTLTIR